MWRTISPTISPSYASSHPPRPTRVLSSGSCLTQEYRSNAYTQYHAPWRGCTSYLCTLFFGPVRYPTCTWRKGELRSNMFAKIAQLSNTLGQHYSAYRGGLVLPPPGMANAQIQQWLIANPHAKTRLETILSGSISPLTGDMNGNPGTPVEYKPNVPPSDPLNTTLFVGGFSPLTSEETLRTRFSCQGSLASHAALFNMYAKSDAERAIEALGGSPIGGNKVRLSWGRIPAAQGVAAGCCKQRQHIPRRRSTHSNPGDGPLSSEQVAGIIENPVPSLMAASHHNHNGAAGPLVL
ncbi:hypothetical protein M408DRAFT_172132 [Serendipita vermifera MAFF 305830]|uniref:RRM domain-containing protein n=1 Tax=Serendipita vermifera MAFF 305830 TaxID=933852 RepID=A0A0C2W019_SERVB|nr:hypothetical protein M408DRAFT_172132 [Serendipita vermifera MAFF 305830]